jgi:hypothetical protein
VAALVKLVSYRLRHAELTPSDVNHSVGLGVDCSALVKSNTITQDDVLDRNWAYWTTFAQVRYPCYLPVTDKMLRAHDVGCILLTVRWT